jgi:hypothetical protein
MKKLFVIMASMFLAANAMAWEATLKINNNTNYNVDVVHNQPEGTLVTLKPGQTGWSWTTSDNNNTVSLRFWQQPNVFFMQGSVSYGPNAGVWVDRGWMDPNAQTITMTANANGTVWVQTSNGGKGILAWNQFQQGGTIELTFNNTGEKK